MTSGTKTGRVDTLVSRPPAGIRKVVRQIAMAPIRFYQIAVSPYRLRTCRFYPSCSQYALTALSRHGIFRGSVLAMRRLLRCHPWSAGGVDPVPK